VELWILLILKAAGGEVCCKTKIVKILFLLEKVYGITGVRFEPYSYGPWSKDVEDALRRLVELGLVEERELQSLPMGHLSLERSSNSSYWPTYVEKTLGIKL
jgi:uncharacterized protein YwgA